MDSTYSSRRAAELLLDEYDVLAAERGLPARDPELNLDSIEELVVLYTRGKTEPPPLYVREFVDNVLFRARRPGEAMRAAVEELAAGALTEENHQLQTYRGVFQDGARGHWLRWNHHPLKWEKNWRPIQSGCRIATVDTTGRVIEKNPEKRSAILERLRRAITLGEGNTVHLD